MTPIPATRHVSYGYDDDLAYGDSFNGVRLTDDAVQRELALARAILGETA